MSHQPPNRHVKMLQGLGLGHEDLTAWEQRAILEALVLRPEDRLLEIGCGGGLLLRDALTCGVESATGLDHSEEMVSPGARARARRRDRGRQGRAAAVRRCLVHRRGDVDRVLLPFRSSGDLARVRSRPGTRRAPRPRRHYGRTAGATEHPTCTAARPSSWSQVTRVVSAPKASALAR